MSKVGNIWRALMRRPKPFKLHSRLVEETYIKTGDRVHAIGAKDVIAAAAVLESAYTMTVDVPHDQLIALTMTRTELHAFVCYMRQLDSAYRSQGEFIAKKITPSSLKLQDGYPSEFKISEEAAQVSAERYAELTGKAVR